MASWYLLDLPGERGRSAKQLSNTLRQFGVSKPIKCFHAFPQAYQACRDKVHSNDLVLVFGSFLVVGEAMGYLDLPT
jgi:dihydrofolate synthase / folylpolyglutamate synthase